MPPPVVDQSQTAAGSLSPRALAHPAMARQRTTVQRASRRPARAESRFNLLDFARQTIKTPATIGAIAPSSKYVARRVVSVANLTAAKTVVELGSGTGVFTEQIVQKLRGDSTFFALELNQAFVQATKNRCPEVPVYHDSAQSIENYLHQHGTSHCDCIISSLPWTIFEPAEQEKLLQTLSSTLAPGGCFVSIVYLGAKTRKRGRHFFQSLPNHFKTVDKVKTVWQNLPPTQIFCCSN